MAKTAYLSVVLMLGGFVSAADQKPSVDFGRQIRPILADKCYACHGPDAAERKAGLRLDQKDAAFALLKSSKTAIVPGHPGKSELLSRIRSPKASDLMPPIDSGKTLSSKEIDLLETWIAQGAPWSEHWAYVQPKRPDLPAVNDSTWSRVEFDRFVLKRLEAEKLSPSDIADNITLARRLYFDLTGLPPSAEDIDAFLRDRKEGAYERLIDRLLESEHYGERMAIFWLDLVRFADTRGYHSDNPRNVSPYRDYVIKSFNENKPFDDFTVEQIAGDLLEEPDVWQRVATCYTKLNQTTEEGGAQPKEYEAMNAADRVRNVSVVWMGATLGCAQCHAHKFDPYSDQDFYKMAAFFADIQEPAIMDRDPGIPVPTPAYEQELSDLAKQLDAKHALLAYPPKSLAKEVAADEAKWAQSAAKSQAPVLGPWYSIGPFRAASLDQAYKTAFPPQKNLDLNAKHDKLAWVKRAKWGDGKAIEFPAGGDNSATYLYRSIEAATDGSLALALGSDDTITVWVNGKIAHDNKVTRGITVDQDRVTISLRAGKNDLLMKICNGSGGYGFAFRAAGDDVPPAIRAILAKEKRSESERSQLSEHYRSISPRLAPIRAEITALEKKRTELEKKLPRCVVAKSGNPRTVRVLPRGNWLDESGPVVSPAIPQYFGKLPTGDKRPTRLDLANWFVDENNPLTARVFVNRLWKLFFGTGLSKRLDDIGAMGEPPSHPDLLDWLTVEFIESGWDVKHIIRVMLRSSTYRQSSIPSQGLVAKDPYNRLLGRQSRWRLDAEVVRDNALAISGLLSRRVGGSSVRPYQPAGYWVHLNFPKRRWQHDKGDALYRRGLYTWWQRSFLHPSLMAFDAPNREECTAERARSNIPQQALVLLNDPTYVEAARVFAERAIQLGGEKKEDRVRWAFRQATSRWPEPEETQLLLQLFEEHRAAYSAAPEDAKKLLGTGASTIFDGTRAEELAAWTSVARTLLNLHETITRN